MSWLIVGSSGYIGQHVVKCFLEMGKSVIGLDIKNPPANSILLNQYDSFIGDIRSKSEVDRIFETNLIEGVINLAALKSVEESILKRDLYNEVNHLAAKQLMEIAIKNRVKFFIQSSTAAVYGESEEEIVDEKSATNPISPYGDTKLKAEHALNQEIENGKIQGCSLRYFNVLGAAHRSLKDLSVSNIVPKVVNAIETGVQPLIYGNDYDTLDGTGVRDYIHVEDVALAHFLLAERLPKVEIPRVMNIGSGLGYSALEVVSEILYQTDSKVQPMITDRRPGDVGKLVARIDLATKWLDFSPTKNLKQMIQSAID
jgi:UDP-glucose 4-epimerase